jgi:hypothetical protein
LGRRRGCADTSGPAATTAAEETPAKKSVWRSFALIGGLANGPFLFVGGHYLRLPGTAPGLGIAPWTLVAGTSAPGPLALGSSERGDDARPTIATATSVTVPTTTTQAPTIALIVTSVLRRSVRLSIALGSAMATLAHLML